MTRTPCDAHAALQEQMLWQQRLYCAFVHAPSMQAPSTLQRLFNAYYNAYYSPLCCGILPGNACERNLFCMPFAGPCLRSNARATASTEQASTYALAPMPAASGLPCLACHACAPSFPPGLTGRGNSLRYRKQAQQKRLARYTASPALCAVRC